MLIQDNGFDPAKSGESSGALLGKGIYCTTNLEKANHSAKSKQAGGIILELQVDLGVCKKLAKNDPMMKSWQKDHDSAWAPMGANASGQEENCVKDPKRIRIIRAIAGDTKKLRSKGMVIDAGTGKLMAICNVAGCNRMAWNGKVGEQCCRTCKSSVGSKHGPDGERKHDDGSKAEDAAAWKAAAEAQGLFWCGRGRAWVHSSSPACQRTGESTPCLHGQLKLMNLEGAAAKNAADEEAARKAAEKKRQEDEARAAAEQVAAEAVRKKAAEEAQGLFWCGGGACMGA